MTGVDLSIIVPVYNTEQYLGQCVQSILAQTYHNYELILVDDGSTDNSAQICDSYSSHKNVKVIHKPNGGLISARKTGVNASDGEYIGFVDADDWIEPDMYARLMHEVKLYSADIISCGYYLEERDSRRTISGTDKKQVIKSTVEKKVFYDGVLAKGFDWTNQRNITPSVCNKVFRKSLLEEVYSKIDERLMWDEDTVTVLSAVFGSECIVLIPEAFYHYRQNMLSMSHTVHREVWSNYEYVFSEINRISEEHDDILDKQIPFFALTAARTALKVGFGVTSGKQYMFPFGEISQGAGILIYGAGLVGRCYYKEVVLTNYASNVCITDSNPQRWGKEVVSPEEAFKEDYDVVLIAVENEDTAKKIEACLIEKGVARNKIFWQKPEVLRNTYSFFADVH